MRSRARKKVELRTIVLRGRMNLSGERDTERKSKAQKTARKLDEPVVK
jgi:hypothetical protein